MAWLNDLITFLKKYTNRQAEKLQQKERKEKKNTRKPKKWLVTSASLPPSIFQFVRPDVSLKN